MAGEEWARRIVQKALKKLVFLHDDGSRTGLYDLRIGPAGTPDVAIECVAAVDPARVETWNRGPARGPVKYGLSGDWTVVITPAARVKPLLSKLEAILQNLEDRGVEAVDVDWWLQRSDPYLHDLFNHLGIEHVSRVRPQGSGRVYLTMSAIVGMVDRYGTRVPTWLGEFLRDPSRQDVLSKLQRSCAKRKEVFVFVDLGGALWEVEPYLMDDFECLPPAPPDLPSPIQGAWMVHVFGRRGLYWDGASWVVVETRGDEIDG